MKNVIGLIHPDSARHHRSKVMRNNPNIVVDSIRPSSIDNGWYIGKFRVLKDISIWRAGDTGHICGFRPRRIKG